MGSFKHPMNVVVTGLCLLVSFGSVLAASADSPYLNPGFSFIYDTSSHDLPIPVTAQCDPVRLRWTRDTNSTGPLPVAPYFLQVYSSSSSSPSVMYTIDAGFGPTFTWPVTFSPNTQYQICMFDSNGSSGGCQQTYTMVPSANTTASPSCQNVTAPNTLSVSAKVPLGAMSQFSYIDQCTSLSVQPTSGSPPFTLTIAPDNHPPYNISSSSIDPISWQVSLPVGLRFFLSLSSADGSIWANGPLLVGGLGSNSCLAPDTVNQSFFQKILISTSIVGIFFGFAIGILSYYLYLKWKRKRNQSPSQSYLAAQYASRNNPKKPLAAPSVISTSVGTTVSSTMPLYTMPAMPLPSTPPSRSNELPLEPVRPTSRPLRPVRPSTGSANPSAERTERILPERPPPSDAESLTSRTQSTSTYFPLDIKKPFITNQSSAYSTISDDDTSLASSSSNITSVRQRSRPLSVQSRAPTYVPRSTNLRTAVINEADDDDMADLPPEYGRHVADHSLTYAPSVLSSGNRF